MSIWNRVKRFGFGKMRIAILYQRKKQAILTTLILLSTACSPVKSVQALPTPVETSYIPPAFNGERAYQDIVTQMDFGPRYPGSEGHTKVKNWIFSELQSAGWNTSVQEVQQGEILIQNIVAKRGQGDPWIILGAHYDTRLYADRDPDPQNHLQPVPGANDGASGVAVLLELARILPDDLPGQLWLVFFDAEDNGDIPGWEWIMGSRAFANTLVNQNLDPEVDAVVVLDMIGDADLNIFQEKNSDFLLTQEIWGVAEELGYTGSFILIPKYRMIDDHVPFLEADIPAVDIIDFDYPYWHTLEDDLNQVSEDSLQAVGDVVLSWVLTKLSAETVP